jgi:imidazolonepropionase-like amidohydrolase
MGRQFGVAENNIRKIDQALEKAFDSLQLAWNAGVKIGSGSDLLGPMQIYKARELELQARVTGPMEALMAATKTNAEILCREDRLGTIEEGKLADLILVDGDPLKDIAVLQDHQDKITLIMQGGNVYKNEL